jgi:hypothetical protein
VDRDNTFSKIKQGVIHVTYNPEATTGLQPKLRVEGSIGFVDIHSTNMAFSKDALLETANVLYDMWYREIKDTIRVLEPKVSRFKFLRFDECVLAGMLGEDSFKL